jgi:phosphoribosylanthranilate isomerase
MVKVKVCGIKRLEDAVLAVELGADFIGLNFWPGTKRVLELKDAQKIAQAIKGRAEIVGVFVNQPLEQVKELAKAVGLDWVQLHGEETPEYCGQIPVPLIKALRLGSKDDLNIMDSYRKVVWLIDSKTKGYGGSGISPNWALAQKAKAKAGEIILAGGLNPENIAAAITTIQPWAVDVASGVETSPGVKDAEKLKKIFEAIKNVTG